MIIISTDYDSDAQILEEVATELAQAAGTQLTAHLDSTTPSDAANVQHALNPHDKKAVCFFVHGQMSPPALVAQDQQPGVDSSKLHLLANRLVCAFSCYSVNILDDAVRHHGATVLGYNGKLMIPRRKRYRSLFRDCLLAGPQALLSPQSSTAATAQLETGNKYRRVVQQLLGGNIADQAIAVLAFDWNANHLDLHGNQSCTL